MNPILLDMMSPLAPLAIAAALLCCALGPAQSPRPADPGLQALLAKMAAARGRSTAPRDTLHATGTYTVTFEGMPEPVAKGAFDDWFAGPHLARHKSDMGPMGAMERGTTEALAWEVDPAMGAKVRRGAQGAAVRRWFAILRGADPAALYGELAKTGTASLDGTECTVLRATPRAEPDGAPAGKPDTWYVDAEGRVRRVDLQLPAPESADATFGMDDMMDAQLRFDDWREVAGLRLPHARTLRMGPATVTFAVAKIEAGVAFAKDRFDPPAAVATASAEPALPAQDADGKPVYRIVDRKEQRVASIRVRCKPAEISATLAVLLPEVMAHLTATGARIAGAPFTRYHAIAAGEIDLEAGIPVQQPIGEKGRVVNATLPAGQTATVWHVGPYEGLAAAHEALQAWVTAQEKRADGAPYEIYWTDPGMVPDPAKWRTQLFQPVR